MALAQGACSESESSTCNGPSDECFLCRYVETEKEHRVAGKVTFTASNGAGRTGEFNSNRTIDPEMKFEQSGPLSTGWGYHPTQGSKSLEISFRAQDPSFTGMDGTVIFFPELPGEGTFPLTSVTYCYCPNERPYPTSGGCSAVDPGYRGTVSPHDPLAKCDSLDGALEVRRLKIKCDETFTPSECGGDLEMTMTITPVAGKPLSGTLEVTEHSTLSELYCKKDKE
ncbi:hypothetical protein LVJ94_51510 [Pendulispora rubella]|uniref:Uncharacterized protein n=1 Tax=Pendulispora rubella TaxID=2741070 RepID=A0ABZ2L314_9BACT